jgi:hypothetical protein
VLAIWESAGDTIDNKNRERKDEQKHKMVDGSKQQNVTGVTRRVELCSNALSCTQYGPPNGGRPANVYQGVLGTRLKCPVQMVRLPRTRQACLNQSKCARASELLLSVPFARRHPPPLSPGAEQSQQSLVPTQVSDVPAPTRHPHAPSLQTQPEDVRALELEFETQEADLLFSARTFIESRDPMRAIHILHSCQSAKAHFLSLYSQFIVRLPPFIQRPYSTKIQGY